MLDDLLVRLRNRDRLALARVLTLVSRGEQMPAIRAAVGAKSDSVPVVALTGNAGVGKSTLVGKLAEHLRALGKTVAILACDPQSPLTGGALLGDRIRMPSRPEDPGLYIRSLAAASGHQAVAEHVDLMIRVLAEYGFDVILLETVAQGRAIPPCGNWPTWSWCWCSPRAATSCNGRRRACWKLPTSSWFTRLTCRAPSGWSRKSRSC